MLDQLQTRWKAAYLRMDSLRDTLKAKYGDSGWPYRQRDRLNALRERESAASDAIFDWLDAHSPRNWRSGVPAYWVCQNLTMADALTSGPLSVVPPCGYGSLPQHVARFAAAIA